MDIIKLHKMKQRVNFFIILIYIVLRTILHLTNIPRKIKTNFCLQILLISEKLSMQSILINAFKKKDLNYSNCSFVIQYRSNSFTHESYITLGSQ